MLFSVVLLVLVIVLSLVFKLYIFKLQLFRKNILEGISGTYDTSGSTVFSEEDTNTYGKPASGDSSLTANLDGGNSIAPINSSITRIESEIAALVLEMEKYIAEADESKRQSSEYNAKIAEFNARINTLQSEYNTIVQQNGEYIAAGESAKNIQKSFLQIAGILRGDISDLQAKIEYETGQAEMVNSIINSFEFTRNGGLVNIKSNKTYVYFYITEPGEVKFNCKSSRVFDYIVLGGGGAGGGNHGGGGGAGVIVGGKYQFIQGSSYAMARGNGGLVVNKQNGAKNIYEYKQLGQPSYIYATNYPDLVYAPGGGYGGGGINGPAFNINGDQDIIGSSGGGMAYNYPAGVPVNTAGGKLSAIRIGSAYIGGAGRIISYMGNAGNGGGGGGAAGVGGIANDTNAGDGGSGIAAPYIPDWLSECQLFMDDDWKSATENGTIIAGGGGGGAWSQLLCVPGKGGRGGGGNGGGCVFDPNQSGMPPGYNNHGLSSTMGVSNCPAPPSTYTSRRHLDNIIGFDGKPGAKNTGSGGGGGSSTGFVGGDGGSGLLVLRIKLDDKSENTKGMNQCKWSYSENPGADNACPSFAKFCRGFIEGRSWGKCSTTQSILEVSTLPKPFHYLPLRTNKVNLGTSGINLGTVGTVNTQVVAGIESVYFPNNFNTFLYINQPHRTTFSFGFWLNVADYGGYTAVSYAKGGNFGDIENPSIQCDFGNGSSVGIYSALPNRWSGIRANEDFVNRWTHFFFLISDALIVMFINGVNRSHVRGSSSLRKADYFILGRSGDNGRAFHGFIHDFVVYNEVLSEEQVKLIYDLTK